MASHYFDQIGTFLTETTIMPAGLTLPDEVEEGSHSCGRCGLVSASLAGRGGHLRIEIPRDAAYPDDLSLTLVAVCDGRTRFFKPSPEALAHLKRAREADWYLPPGVTPPSRAALHVTYKGNESMGENWASVTTV